jgi:two-component system, NtrC family, sensor histidine kinase HupT/HoxJ
MTCAGTQPMTNDRLKLRGGLAGLISGDTTSLSDDRESAWLEVIQRVDEVYSDLIRYEADLERKNSELEEAQGFISSVIASVSDILIVCDGAGRILQVNPAFLRLVDRTQQEAVGCNFSDFLVEQDRANAMRIVTSGAEGRVDECELRFESDGKRSDVFAMVCSTRFDHRSRRAGAVLTGRPTGELRRAYEALHQAHLDLQQAQRKLIEQEKMASLGRLVAGVAHELNNPISFVYGNIHTLDRYRKRLDRYFAELDLDGDSCDQRELRDRYRVDAIMHDLTSLIEGTLEGATRISEIVRNLRRLSFTSAGETQSVELGKVIGTAANWAARTKLSKARIVLDIEDGATLEGSEGQIHQIAVNLIENALDAVRASPNPEVSIRVRRVGAEIEWTVADNGPGIADEIQDKIFEPFFTTKSVGDGTGLGLWISYSIAREHGGGIVAGNRPEGGALFTVTLPAGTDEGS